VKKLITIELFGQSYRFESHYEAERAEAVRDLLVNEVEKMETHHASQSPSHSVSKFALLISAALNIANENIELKDHGAAFCREIRLRSESILEKLGRDRASTAGFSNRATE
jgi:hypothetical protein